MTVRPTLIVFALLITIASTIAEDLTINCLFEPDKKVYESKTDKFLTCNLMSNLTTTANVTEAIGEPGSIKPTDVKIFEVTEVLIQRIPKGLKRVFPNLIGIKIYNTDFNYLSKDDLAEYNLLQYLEISSSKLSVVLGDTFSNSSKLELIDLSKNSIFYIGANAFNGLNSLSYLNLDELLCLLADDGVADTPDKLTALISLLPSKCGASMVDMALTAVMKSYLDAIEASQSCGPENPELECPDCEDELKELKLKYNNQTDLLKACESDTSALNNDVLKLQQEVEELKALTSVTADGTCGFKTVSNVYSCYAKISVKTAAEQTVKWNGTHESKKENKDVLSMVIYGQTVEIMPLNIGSTFANLKYLTVKNSGLTKIKSGDFKNLAKLQTLEISGNSITTIDAASFAGLPLLKELDLSANKITGLPSKVFETLSALSILNLSGNSFRIRYDIINTSNNIAEAYLGKNEANYPIDRTLIWRLQKAVKIDLSGTGCNYSLDKVKVPQTFMDFYSTVSKNC